MSVIKEIREKVKSLNVLVVDDEEKILQGAKLFLEKFFENVDSAKNGKIALEMFKNNSKYDVVITDLEMPMMSGLELIEELRIIDKELFIVAMSGSHEENNKHIDSMNIFLKKPIDIDDMFNMLNTIIQKKGL